jgi:ADP-ribosylglycohydrolase
MNHQDRLHLARKALDGIAIGDAFGESFFGQTDQVLSYIQKREIPESSWEFTDDTVMAISVYEQLDKYSTIDQDHLAKAFAEKHKLDPNRGYGATARMILRSIENGENWRKVANEVFDGMGSMGNGAAMRVAPIGAYFWDDLEQVKEECQKSAVVTHAHPEASVGAMAVGIATALSANMTKADISFEANDFIKAIVEQLPVSDTRSKIEKSMTLPLSYDIRTIQTVLGNGTKMLAQDTVPFSIWCAAHHLSSFEDALWKAVSVLGDRDTICAIVGGIVMMSSKTENIPSLWKNQVETWWESPFI